MKELVAMASALVVTAWSAGAFACSCGPPPTEFLTGGTIPENGVVPVYELSYRSEPPDWRFETEQAGAWTDLGDVNDYIVPSVGLGWGAVLTHSWQSGERYRVVEYRENSNPIVQTEFEIGDAVDPETTDVEAAVAVESREVPHIESAECSREVGSQAADISLALPANLEPYADAIVWEQRVDGSLYRHREGSCTPRDLRADRGPAQFVLAAACEQDESGFFPSQRLDSGVYEVDYYGYIPGTDVELRSGPISVDLTCPPRASEPVEEGCSAASSGTPSALLALLAFAILSRRRRD